MNHQLLDYSIHIFELWVTVGNKPQKRNQGEGEIIGPWESEVVSHFWKRTCGFCFSILEKELIILDICTNYTDNIFLKLPSPWICIFFPNAGASGEQWCSPSDVPRHKMRDVNEQLKAVSQGESLCIQWKARPLGSIRAFTWLAETHIMKANLLYLAWINLSLVQNTLLETENTFWLNIWVFHSNT